MSQTAFRPDSTPHPQGPAERRGSSWRLWVLTVLTVAGTLAFEIAWRQIAEWSYAGCDGFAREVGQGQISLAVLWGVVSVGWLIPAWYVGWRAPVVGGALLCSAVAAWFFWQGLDPAWWTDGFCVPW